MLYARRFVSRSYYSSKDSRVSILRSKCSFRTDTSARLPDLIFIPGGNDTDNPTRCLHRASIGFRAGQGVVMKVLRLLFLLPVLMSACATGEPGGLVDLKSDEAPTVEVEFQKQKWNSPPLLEFGVKKGDLLGYYSRPEQSGLNPDDLEVFNTSRNLLFVVKAVIQDDGREMTIFRDGEKYGVIRSEYAPSTPRPADMEYPDPSVRLDYGYARKGGSDGYRHEQWILSREGLSQMIFETRYDVQSGNIRRKLVTTPGFLASGDDALMWLAITRVLIDIDDAERNREQQEEAMRYLMDEARKDSGFSLF